MSVTEFQRTRNPASTEILKSEMTEILMSEMSHVFMCCYTRRLTCGFCCVVGWKFVESEACCYPMNIASNLVFLVISRPGLSQGLLYKHRSYSLIN